MLGKKVSETVLPAPPDNSWLGPPGVRQNSVDDQEWPVAYHGTPVSNVYGIVSEGFKLENGKNFLFGKGIYASPYPDVAKEYAHIYSYEV